MSRNYKGRKVESNTVYYNPTIKRWIDDDEFTVFNVMDLTELTEKSF